MRFYLLDWLLFLVFSLSFPNHFLELLSSLLRVVYQRQFKVCSGNSGPMIRLADVTKKKKKLYLLLY